MWVAHSGLSLHKLSKLAEIVGLVCYVGNVVRYDDYGPVITSLICCMASSSFRHVDKKRKLGTDSDSDYSESELDWDPEDEYRQDIASDISLEIGLRERLLQTVESRIEWALRLQASLQSGASQKFNLILPTELFFRRIRWCPTIRFQNCGSRRPVRYRRACGNSLCTRRARSAS